MASDPVKYLRTLPSIRERCGRILALAREGKLENFKLDESKLDEVAEFVLQTMKDAYPGGIEDVKFHSRWRHFEPNGVDRVGEMEAKWGECDALERARRHIDLAVVSVLLDAGAGPAWRYTEPGTGHVLERSEGLGVASFHMFCSGAFSSDAAQPFRADAKALSELSPEAVATAFQAGESNPLVGAEGRAALLRRLGDALAGNDTHFAGADAAAPHRPGNVVDFLVARSSETAGGRRQVQVADVWECVLDGLQAMWPATRTALKGANMGDVWPHSGLGGNAEEGENLVPFHKLSQWLTYSLMEPLTAGGIDVVGMEHMTGLAEYRNGGLLVDLGLLVPSAAVLAAPLAPHSEAIVEWRALTVALLDVVAQRFRALVGRTEADLPLVVILEAGTWKAGRVAAKARRPDGSPPIRIVSDGTVF